MKVKLLTLLITLFTAISPRVSAQAIYYVRPGAQGSNDGSNWANAYSRFPETLSRGATYYIANGSYSQRSFSSAEVDAKTIVIMKATGREHGTDDGWQDVFGNGVAEFTGILFESDWWILDGGSQSGSGSSYGIKIANSADRVAMVTISGKRSHITLRNIELAGDPALTNRSSGVYAVQGPSHLFFQKCYLHDFFGVPFHLIDAAHVTIEHSLIARNKSTAEWHSEGIQARGCTDLTVRYNTWEDMNGTATIVSGSGHSSGWSIYGNIFNRGNVGHGIVADNMVDSIEDVTVSGNIIIGYRGNAGMNFYKAKGRITVVDNVWYDNPWVSFNGITNRDYNYFSKCRFPYAFRSEAHESRVQEGKDGQYSTQNTPPFVDFEKKNFTLTGEALQTLTHEKN